MPAFCHFAWKICCFYISQVKISHPLWQLMTVEGTTTRKTCSYMTQKTPHDLSAGCFILIWSWFIKCYSGIRITNNGKMVLLVKYVILIWSWPGICQNRVQRHVQWCHIFSNIIQLNERLKWMIDWYQSTEKQILHCHALRGADQEKPPWFKIKTFKLVWKMLPPTWTSPEEHLLLEKCLGTMTRDLLKGVMVKPSNSRNLSPLYQFKGMVVVA